MRKSEADLTPPAIVDYWGAVLTLKLTRLKLYHLHFPECEVAHGRLTTLEMGRAVVDWFYDTGGDLEKWPAKYRHERWVRPQPKPGPVASPPEPAKAEPAAPWDGNTVELVKGRGGKKREVKRTAGGKLVF